MSEAEAVKVLEQCLSGEIPEANALPQLLHIHSKTPRAVVAALSEKANAIMQQADAGPAATRAGAFLVSIANQLDRQVKEAAEKATKKVGKGSQQLTTFQEISKPLLEHILLLSGGKNRAAKDKAVRTQGCTMISALATAVPGHRGAEEKLLEFSLDRVPSIREKAVRGLAGLSRSSIAEMALIARTTDQCTAVRASAVRSLHVSSSTAATLLERIDDVEACVRAQLFMRLAEQPTAIADLGPAALARLVAGLSDRSSSVRSAAGQAVDTWVENLGGAMTLLTRCDVMSDESLGEAAAAALASRYPDEGLRVAKMWLGEISGQANSVLPEGPAPVLFARLAIAAMKEEVRDEVLDIPSLLKRTVAAMEAAQRKDTSSSWHEYLLRQLLHVVALADICDEAQRRQVEKVAELVLFKAPLPSTSLMDVGTTAATCRMAQSAIDLGVVIVRKCSGLTRFQAHSAKHQAVEARCSTRVVLLVSELCAPLTEAAMDDEGETQFTTRLSLQLQELDDAIEHRMKTKASIAASMKTALASEDYIQAQKLKEQTRKNDRDLERLEGERAALREKRDSLCLRVLAIVSALLRWSNSDVRKDPALMGTLDQILLPLVSLPALTKEVEVSVVYAICLFCVRDGAVARGHWSLLLTLLRGLQEVPAKADTAEGLIRIQCDRARAAIAARALSDCARLHGAILDREEVLSAATALAAVPYDARHVAIEPLCGWLLNLGHIFFEEHLREPVLEVQWALSWMLVEAFKQRRPSDDIEIESKKPQPVMETKKRGMSWVTRPAPEPEVAPVIEKVEKSDMEENPAEAIAMSSRLTQFFSLLPKLPGKHGGPMLSLAVEFIAESGLWRRGCLLPQTIDGQTRWLRAFSWPELFAFAHERVPVEMRFRLWRASLQICVASPALAPLAEIPFALASAASEAPAGAAELLAEALELGADPDALAPLRQRLPQAQEALKQKAPPALGVPSALADPKLLLTPAAAEAAERAKRAELSSLGINVDIWAPADIEVPKITPLHHRMRAAPRKPRGPKQTGTENIPVNANVEVTEKNKSQSSAEEEAVQEPEKKTRRTGKQAEQK